jgi:hypothetical protein
MGCNKCGGNKRSGNAATELKRYAYLTPRQLRYLKQLENNEEENPTGDGFVKDKKE